MDKNNKDKTEQNEKKDTLFLIKREKCTYCEQYEKIWPNIEQHLKIRGGVKTEVILVKGIPFPDGPFKDLERFIGWYPTLVRVRYASVEQAKKVPKTKLDAFVYNGERLSNGRIVAKIPNYPMGVDQILPWLKETDLEDSKLPNINNPIPPDPIIELQNYCTGNRKSKKHSYV